MSGEAYELLAMGARYWFVLLGALIVWRSFSWLVRDARARRRELSNLPDAGLVGEVVNLATGKAYPLPFECTLGGGRGCDVYIPGVGLKHRHMTLLLVRGKGVRVTLSRGATAVLDGLPIEGTAYALHGARIEMPGCALRVRLFAGLPIPSRPLYQSHEEREVIPDQSEEYPFGVEDAEEYPFGLDDASAQMGYAPAYAPLAEEDTYPFGMPSDSVDDQNTWPYAPYPPEMLAQALQQAENDDFIANVPERPERHRRAGKRGRRR